MNWNKIRAIAIGAMVGGLLVHLFAPAGMWYLLGVPGGAAFGWLAYCFPAIRREAPRVWANMTSRETSEAFFGALSDVGVAGITSIGAAISVGATVTTLGWLLGFRFTPLATEKYVVFVILYAAMIWALMVLMVSVTSRRRTFRGITANFRKVAVFANPIGLAYLVLRGLWWSIPRIPKGTRVIGVFGVRLFVRVHSNDALDCAVYGAFGPLLASFITKDWPVIVLSALIGVACALVFGRLAGYLRRTYPALS